MISENEQIVKFGDIRVYNILKTNMIDKEED